MPGLLQRLAGATLKGVGEGIKLRGAELREEKLARMKAEAANDLQDKRISADDQRGLLTMEHRKLLAGNRATREDARHAERMATLAKNETNATQRHKERLAAIKPKDTSAAKKRDFDNLVKIHTTTDNNGVEKVDWNAIGKGLQEKGHGTLARQALSRGKGINDLARRKAAEAQADAEVEEKTGVIFDDFDDPRDGGSPARFRARRIREIMAGDGGKSGGGKPGKDLRDASAGKPSTGAVIDITGTQQSQREQLSKVPLGARVRIKGKLYQKQAGGFIPIDER